MRSLAFILSTMGAVIAASALSKAEAADPRPAEGAPQVTFADLRTDQDGPSFRVEPVRHRRYYYGYGPRYSYRPYYYYQPYYSYRPYYYDYPYYGGYYGRPYWDHGNVAPGVYLWNF